MSESRRSAHLDITRMASTLQNYIMRPILPKVQNDFLVDYDHSQPELGPSIKAHMNENKPLGGLGYLTRALARGDNGTLQADPSSESLGSSKASFNTMFNSHRPLYKDRCLPGTLQSLGFI